jgi:DNA-binding SARP family transcriptional activator
LLLLIALQSIRSGQLRPARHSSGTPSAHDPHTRWQEAVAQVDASAKPMTSAPHPVILGVRHRGTANTSTGREGTVSLKLQLFGQVQVVVDGTTVTPNSRILRRLLAVLMLQANRMVTIERLAGVLWDDPPASYNANLRTHVSAARRVLQLDGRSRVAHHVGGYHLIVHPGELDLDEFRRLTARGRSQLAAGDLTAAREALGAAVTLSSMAAGNCLNAQGQLADQLAAIDSERLQVFEEWIDARLQSGEASSLVGTVHAHVADHPTREYAWGQLMRACYHAGDVAAALRAYTRAWNLLVGQLGVEPGTHLRILQQAILARDESTLHPHPRWTTTTTTNTNITTPPHPAAA